jgi:hypothetical protein
MAGHLPEQVIIFHVPFGVSVVGRGRLADRRAERMALAREVRN